MDYSFSSQRSQQQFQYGQEENTWSRGNSERAQGGPEAEAEERVGQSDEASEADNSWLDSWESSEKSGGGCEGRGGKGGGEESRGGQGGRGGDDAVAGGNSPGNGQPSPTGSGNANNGESIPAGENAPVQAPESPASSSPSNGSGTFQLGNTSIKMSGGSAEMQARLEANFTGMYNSSPAFKDVIDSKAGSGITVGIEDLGGNTAGIAALGGSDMKMDDEIMASGSDSSLAEVIAHEVGHLAGMGHGTELDNFAVSAGSSYA